MRPVIVLPLHAAVPSKAVHSILIHLQRLPDLVEVVKSPSQQAVNGYGEARLLIAAYIPPDEDVSASGCALHLERGC